MHRDATARVAFGDGVANIDDVADLAIVGHHHRPLEAGDLAGSETGLDRQQHDDGVALRLRESCGRKQACAAGWLAIRSWLVCLTWAPPADRALIAPGVRHPPPPGTPDYSD